MLITTLVSIASHSLSLSPQVLWDLALGVDSWVFCIWKLFRSAFVYQLIYDLPNELFINWIFDRILEQLSFYKNDLKGNTICLITTAPSVVYRVHCVNGDTVEYSNPSLLPELGQRKSIEEPYVKIELLTPKDYIGSLMELAQDKRGVFKDLKFITENRASLIYELPLSEILYLVCLIGPVLCNCSLINSQQWLVDTIL